MDVGVTASFDFTGAPPFSIEWSEQRKGGKAVTRSRRFDGFVGEVVLQPDQEGQYTYVSETSNFRLRPVLF
jgi:nucleoporin POM152